MQSHTRIIQLLVSLCFRRSQKCVLQSDANVGNGTLAPKSFSGYCHEQTVNSVDDIATRAFRETQLCFPRCCSTDRDIASRRFSRAAAGPAWPSNPHRLELDVGRLDD